MAKRFNGSIIVLVILVLFCWPLAIVYYIVKREEEAPPMPMRLCMRCGQQVAVQYSVCPYCQNPMGGGAPPPQQGYPPQQQQYPPPR